LKFDILAAGTSSLDVAINALGDSFGDPLRADVESGSVSVVSVPEPGTVWLFRNGMHDQMSRVARIEVGISAVARVW
jgi:hypothetical protein